MKFTRMLSIFALIGSTGYSQTAGRQVAPVSILKQYSSAALQVNCPIQLKGTLYAVGGVDGVQPIENGQTVKRSQRIRVTLANPESQIAAVQLTVYGFPVGSRVDPAVAYGNRDGINLHNNPAEIHKTIAFDRAIAAQQSASIDVSLRDFSLVSSIDLDSIHYSDGSRWHTADDRYCQAVALPSGALPIDGAAMRP